MGPKTSGIVNFNLIIQKKIITDVAASISSTEQETSASQPQGFHPWWKLSMLHLV